MSLLRTLRTIRYLRWRQLVAQARVRLRRMWKFPWRAPAALPFPGCRWQPAAGFLPPGPQRNAREDLLSGRFTFLNRTETLGWPPRWHRPDLPRLWQYNLHYFEYLWALDFSAAKAVIDDWIERHPYGPAAVGWEPYPISLRLSNWCGYLFERHREETEQDIAFRDRVWGSLSSQAEYLRRNLEFHLLANHLFENAAALVLIGRCLCGQLAKTWYKTGALLLEGELSEQILADGGHFERSPMYHDRVAYVLTTLLNVGDVDLRGLVSGPLAKVLRASVQFRLGDGEVALSNDSAHGVYNSGIEVRRFAERAGFPTPLPSVQPGPFALPESGYYGWTSTGGTGVICDAGPIGPDYQPGHAHGDTFSFELCYGGTRVVVDSGVFDYEPSEMRRYCRSTAAHNTVEIDGQDQCEFWGAFRVARRARPRNVVWEPTEEGFRLAGWHDGYTRLPGRPIHRREFVWHARGVLMVRDVVRSNACHDIVSRIHLHPASKVIGFDAREVKVATPAGSLTILIDGRVSVGVSEGWYCPEFGVRMRNQVVTLTASAVHMEFGYCCLMNMPAAQFSLGEGVVGDDYGYGWRISRRPQGTLR